MGFRRARVVRCNFLDGALASRTGVWVADIVADVRALPVTLQIPSTTMHGEALMPFGYRGMEVGFAGARVTPCGTTGREVGVAGTRFPLFTRDNPVREIGAG